MAKVVYKRVKPLPSPQATVRSIAASIRKELEPVRQAHKDRRNAVVRDFTHKPEFDATISVRGTGIELKVILKNDRESIGGKATMADLVKWLFESGTRPHIIRAKAGKVLRFIVGSYSRKAGIGGSRGGGLSGGGKVVFAKQVRHPGFKPSDALKNINKQLGIATNKAIKKGFHDGFNRLK